MYVFKVALITSFLSFSSLSFGAGLCVDLFSDSPSVIENQVPFAADEEKILSEADKLTNQIEEQNGALKKIAIQHLYERAIDFLQTKVTGSSIRSTEAIKNRNKLQLIYFLKSGKDSSAINIYRQIFDGVELSYYRIKQDLATLEKLHQLPKVDKTEIVNLQLRLQVYQRRFAKNYGEYLEIRSYLENVGSDPKSDPMMAETAKKTLRFLGVHKFAEKNIDYISLEIPEQRPTITDIKQLFRSKAQYTRMKLFGDFKAEILTVVRYLISSEVVIGTIDSIFNKFSYSTALKLKKFTGLLQSKKIRSRYLNVVIDIETLPEDMNLKLESLRKKNAGTPNDELMITFARTVDFSESWNNLKEAAKEKSLRDNDIIYKNFYDRMLLAEAKATKLSDISIFDKDSNIDNMIVIIQTGLILKFAGPEVFHSASGFFNYVLSILGG